MDKIKKAFKFGDPSNADYQHDIERMRREQEQQMKQMEYDRQRQMMNSAQNYAGQQGAYGQGWNDPRGMMNARPISREEALVDSLAETNQVMRRLSERMEKQERRVDMLTGFYTWVIEVYPEIAAQHKAMRELYEAANAPQEEKAS